MTSPAALLPRVYCEHVPHEPRPLQLAVVVAAAVRRAQAAVDHPAYVAAEAGGEAETDGVAAEVDEAVQQQQVRLRAGPGYGKQDGGGRVGGQAGDPVQTSGTGDHQLQGDDDDVSDVLDDDESAPVAAGELLREGQGQVRRRRLAELHPLRRPDYPHVGSSCES